MINRSNEAFEERVQRIIKENHHILNDPRMADDYNSETGEQDGIPYWERDSQMRRVWFYRPQWYWFGWHTLLPVYLGGDEHGRRTLMFGWTFTGRVVVAFS